MEHCFRIALWMLFLVGYLQAIPVTSKKAEQNTNLQGNHLLFLMSDLGLNFLTEEVKIGDNVTFTSPTNVPEHCHAAALQCFIQGLKHARTNCLQDTNDRISQTLEALESKPIQTNSSQCKWENNESRKTFAEFVIDLKSLVQLLNIKTLGVNN